jgi:hypothetical protein
LGYADTMARREEIAKFLSVREGTHRVVSRRPARLIASPKAL